MENNQTVEINKTILTQQVDAGMKKKELAKHYGISELQMGKALKEAGLTIRKFHHAKFKLVEDTAQDAPEVLVDNNPVNTTTTDDVKETPEIIQEDTAQSDVTQVDDTENNEEENNNGTAEQQSWS